MPTSPPDSRPVHKCVCENVTFAELLASGCATCEEAMERFGCGTWCGSCRPYLKLVFETGEVRFSILMPEDEL